MVELRMGLSEKEAEKRLSRDGRNELRKPKKKSIVKSFLEQLRDPLVYVLMVAAFVSILLKEYSDAAIIAAVVFLNACVGLIQEGKAQKALEALEELQSPVAAVIRGGRKRKIPAAQLVVGDLVCLEAGDRVPADLMLTQALGLMTEESALTGESMPVEKRAADKGFKAPAEGEDALPGDRKSMAYSSTMVTAGRGEGLVTATGMQTEIGKIAGMIHREKEELTPLQKRLGELGTLLSFLSLVLCGVLFGIAVLQKRDVMQMLLTAISLAVAAVPEGLPAVVTICLALSVSRLVKAGTIVRRLPSVETLGAVNVVCSDKTGTLTQNRMRAEMGYWDGRVHSFSEGSTSGHVPPEDYVRGLVLCTNADPVTGGDPLELALLQLGKRYGGEREKLEREWPRVEEIPFSSETKQMTTVHEKGGHRIAYCKGAPDVILEKCKARRMGDADLPMGWQDKREILQAVSDLGGMAYRTLAIAKKSGAGARGEWTFLGLIALGDPPRPEAGEAVMALRGAGVTTVMITGDHVKTALAMGKLLGIANREAQTITGDRLTRLSEEELAREIQRRDLRIFARVSPLQKVQIVKAFQRQGSLVAMTGDGVNDAPSLKAADIGIAMGRGGTDVAKEAADLILTDDNFATIERAIEEGRGVYENIRKSVIFLLSSNLGELLTMFLAVVCGFPSPLKSSHVLWINLITDSLPALALGVDPCDGKELMKYAPRKTKESLFSRGGLGCTCFYGVLIAAISLSAYALAKTPAQGETYAFTVLGMSQLFHAVGMRDVTKSIFRMKHWENRVMILAVILGYLLQVAVTEIPFLIRAFGTVRLCPAEWGILTALAAAPLLAHELIVLAGREGKGTKA